MLVAAVVTASPTEGTSIVMGEPLQATRPVESSAKMDRLATFGIRVSRFGVRTTHDYANKRDSRVESRQLLFDRFPDPPLRGWDPRQACPNRHTRPGRIVPI